jgi:regulator of cell morphogenesis and NO signaling
MLKEEQVLFPYIRQLERGDSEAAIDLGALSHPMHQLENEHEHAGAALKQMRELSDNYTAGDWGCNTYRVMLDALRELEANMHEHVHKENNVLFIKAADLQTRRLTDRTSTCT